jgi:hypothetical protein
MSASAEIDLTPGLVVPEVGVATPSYAPSWLNRLVTWIDRLPLPFWVSIAALWVAATLFWHAIAWSGGQVPVGESDRTSAFWMILGPALLWSAAYMGRVAPVLASPSGPSDPGPGGTAASFDPVSPIG